MNTGQNRSDEISEKECDPTLTPNQILEIREDLIARQNFEAVYGPIPLGPKWDGRATTEQILDSFAVKHRKCVNPVEQMKADRKFGSISARDEDRRHGRS